MGQVAGGGMVLQPGEARTIDLSGATVTVHASSELTGGLFSLLETAETALGSGPPLHVHRDAAESFYVLEGLYVMHLDGEEFRCPQGSFIYVPRGMRHTFRPQAVGSRKLNLYTPSAMEGYFEELAEALRTGVDDTELSRIAERYSMEVIGPVPEGYL